MLTTNAVGRVVLTFHRMELDKVQRAIEACETEGVEAWLNADFIHTSAARPSYEVLAKRPMLVFRASPELSWAMLVKVWMDRVLAGIGLVVLLPVFGIIAVVIRHTSPGPVFFRQVRTGRDERPFSVLKFRTMSEDAEERKSEIMHLNEVDGPLFKVSEDPRITRPGHFLRRTSLDELPQLINVWKGDMSLVGPRPFVVSEAAEIEGWARKRFEARPGMTGLWQVSGRNELSHLELCRLDYLYVASWSFWWDMQILWQTPATIFKGRGAS